MVEKDDSQKNREKTYLIILSFLIIGNQFTEITIDSLNILGNEATVQNEFVVTTVILMWLYFLFLFLQRNGYHFKQHIESKIYLKSLQKRLGKKIKERFNSKNHQNVPGNYRIADSSEYRKIKKGYEIPVFTQSGYGDTTELDPIKFKTTEIPFEIFWSYLCFVVLDPSFTQRVFPILISLTAGTVLLCSFLQQAAEIIF